MDLKRLYRQNHYTLKELAEFCEVSPSYLSLILNGKQKATPEIINKLALKFSLSVDDVKKSLDEMKQSKVKGHSIAPPMYLKLLEQALDTLDRGDSLNVEALTLKLKEFKSQSILIQRYLEWYVAWEAILKNHFTEALPFLEKAQGFKAKSELEKRLMGRVLVFKGVVYSYLGDHKMAIHYFRKSLFVWGGKEQAGVVYCHMGTLFRKTYKYKQAIKVYEKAISYGPNYVQLEALSNMVQIALAQKDQVLARKYLLGGYKICKKTKEFRGKADLFYSIGFYYEKIGQLKRAKSWLKRAIAVPRSGIRAKSLALVELVNIMILEGDLEKADDLISQINIDTNSDVLLLCKQLMIIAKRDLHNNDKILYQCYLLLQQIPPSLELIDCCTLLRNYHKLYGDYDFIDFYDGEIKRLKRTLKS